MVTQLKERLLDIVELEAFSNLDPSKLPESLQKALVLTEIVLEIKQTSVKRRYVLVTLKQLHSQGYCQTKCKEFLTLVSTESTLMTMFPNFTVLASIAPVSTAECERCFSKNQDCTQK